MLHCQHCFSEIHANLMYCPECGLSYHKECWIKNGSKCAISNCSGELDISSVEKITNNKNDNNNQSLNLTSITSPIKETKSNIVILAVVMVMIGIVTAAIFIALSKVSEKNISSLPKANQLNENLTTNSSFSDTANVGTPIPEYTEEPIQIRYTSTPIPEDIDESVFQRPHNIFIDLITASSELKDTVYGDYLATNLIDGDTHTCWQEFKKGNGIGEWIELDFQEENTVTSIEINNGFAYPDHPQWGNVFLKNPRVKKATLLFSNGKIMKVNLLDIYETQQIEIPKIKSSSIKLIIDDIYLGNKWTDTSISEIKVYGY